MRPVDKPPTPYEQWTRIQGRMLPEELYAADGPPEAHICVKGFSESQYGFWRWILEEMNWFQKSWEHDVHFRYCPVCGKEFPPEGMSDSGEFTSEAESYRNDSQGITAG